MYRMKLKKFSDLDIEKEFECNDLYFKLTIFRQELEDDNKKTSVETYKARLEIDLLRAGHYAVQISDQYYYGRDMKEVIEWYNIMHERCT